MYQQLQKFVESWSYKSFSNKFSEIWAKYPVRLPKPSYSYTYELLTGMWSFNQRLRYFLKPYSL